MSTLSGAAFSKQVLFWLINTWLRWVTCTREITSARSIIKQRPSQYWLKMASRKASTRSCKSASNSDCSLGMRQVSKKRRPVKRSEPSSTIDNHVRSDEAEKECTAELKTGDPGPARSKRKSKNRTDGDEDVPLRKKLRKSKSMSKRIVIVWTLQ